jgi:hypothetical protein
MKQINLVTAIGWTIWQGWYLVTAFLPENMAKYPNAYYGDIIFLPPLLLNWLSFSMWEESHVGVKRANLVVAVIYSVLFILFLWTGLAYGPIKARGVLDDTLVYAIPIAINWFSYFYWPKKPIIAHIQQ